MGSGQDSHDAWMAGQSYEHYMGRWSRQIATRFVDWLDPPGGLDWLETGCGTGALTSAILDRCDPASVLATDPSGDFVRHAAGSRPDDRARYVAADALDLPAGDSRIDIVASGLVLNFIPDRPAALREMRRVLRPGGTIAFYVWDYPGGGMGFIDAFWRAAIACDPQAAALDESARFPFCTRDALVALCADAGLDGIRSAGVEIPTDFDDFEAFWHPFTLGTGPAPGYCLSLDDAARDRLKRTLAASLGAAGRVSLPARAWAVSATVP